jgi:hypothetical protein
VCFEEIIGAARVWTFSHCSINYDAHQTDTKTTPLDVQWKGTAGTRHLTDTSRLAVPFHSQLSNWLTKQTNKLHAAVIVLPTVPQLIHKIYLFLKPNAHYPVQKGPPFSPVLSNTNLPIHAIRSKFFEIRFNSVVLFTPRLLKLFSLLCSPIKAPYVPHIIMLFSSCYALRTAAERTQTSRF